MFNVKDAAKAVQLAERLKALVATRKQIVEARRINLSLSDHHGHNAFQVFHTKLIDDDRDTRALRAMLLGRYDNAIEAVKREFRQIDCVIPGEDA